MKNERETKQKLLECAKKEFMEKGYTGASLRSICKQAEVTTGALYFFFKDKADLFAALVREPLEGLLELMAGHYQAELESAMDKCDIKLDASGDMQAAIQILHYIYQHYDAFELILSKSQGSGFEGSMERIIEISQEHYRILLDQICRGFGAPLVDDYLIHWFSHMQADIFVYMITHHLSEEEACRYIEPTVRFLFSGFFGMLKPHGNRKLEECK